MEIEDFYFQIANMIIADMIIKSKAHCRKVATTPFIRLVLGALCSRFPLSVQNSFD